LSFDASSRPVHPVRMDQTLPLNPLHALLPLDRPFTRGMASAVGIERASLERMMREGAVRRLLRGAYVASNAPDTSGLRAAAVALVVGREAIAIDRTAAWVHGVEVTALGAQATRPVEILTPGRTVRGPLRSVRQLSGHDVQRIEGLRLTTPLRTALDLGRLLPPDLALGVMDGLLSGGAFTHVQLLAEIPRLAGLRGVGQLRTLAVQVDARSMCLAESTLRLHWHQARLPTAVPGMPAQPGGRATPVRRGAGRSGLGS
jgi:hypothetical protein